MHQIFFIHSSVDGHSGCFHVLAIVYRAVMNIGVHVSFHQTFAFSLMFKSSLPGPSGHDNSWNFFVFGFLFFPFKHNMSRLLYSSLTPNRLNYLPSPAYSQSGRELTSRGSHFVSWALQCQMDDITTTCWVAEQKGNLFLKGQKFKLLFSF